MKHKEEVRPSAINREERPERTSIHGGKDLLSVDGQEPGFHYCWVNDYNVSRFEKAGYEFVTHEVVIGSRRVDAVTGIGAKHSLPVGNGVTAYLMRIPEEYFNEDNAALEKKVDEAEAAMFENLNSSKDGRYGKVEIQTNRKRIN
jgi:hypothetical protein